jgi:transketolase
MRAAFVRGLIDIARRDARVVLLTGDLGFMALEPFQEAYPDRFFNVGVAEQNMVGIATGLAEAGFIPFAYSIATFASLRTYEFIRNGPVLHRLPVRVVGVGGGFEYGSAGPTHYGLEDLALMRTQPGLTVIGPSDHRQALSALEKTWDLPGPVYYRLGKDDRTVVPGLEGHFDLGRAETVRTGDDALFITTGSVAVEVTRAAEILAGHGVESTIVIVASISPAPVHDVRKVLARFPVAYSVEAHFVDGGLGSLVAEIIADAGLRCRLSRLAVSGSVAGRSGSQAWALKTHGLDAASVAAAVRKDLARAA